jgi:hypothetical protein
MPFGVFPYREAGERAAHRHLGDRGRQDQDVDRYPESTIIFSQLGVLANLQATLMPVGGAQYNGQPGWSELAAAWKTPRPGGKEQ